MNLSEMADFFTKIEAEKISKIAAKKYYKN